MDTSLRAKIFKNSLPVSSCVSDVLKMIEDEAPTIEIANVVEHDPILSVQLIEFFNRAGNLRFPIVTVKQIFDYYGFSKVKNTIIALGYLSAVYQIGREVGNINDHLNSGKRRIAICENIIKRYDLGNYDISEVVLVSHLITLANIITDYPSLVLCDDSEKVILDQAIDIVVEFAKLINIDSSVRELTTFAVSNSNEFETNIQAIVRISYKLSQAEIDISSDCRAIEFLNINKQEFLSNIVKIL